MRASILVSPISLVIFYYVNNKSINAALPVGLTYGWEVFIKYALNAFDNCNLQCAAHFASQTSRLSRTQRHVIRVW
jgi:hypothetical protein